MPSLHNHELHKIIDDLSGKQAYQLAFEICEHYVDQFEDGYLTYCYLTLPWKMGQLDQTIELLSAAIDEQRWISPWMINRFGLFAEFRDEPTFQALMSRLEECERLYWASDCWRPITSHPTKSEPHPLLIGLHGNGFDATHSAESWAPAEGLGWLTTHPNAPNIVGYQQHWWLDIEKSKHIVQDHLNHIHQQYAIDSDHILLCGFSSGGQVALHLALEGKIGAQGFILVGAGGQYFNKPPAYWEPLMQNAPKRLRGVMLYSDYDMERSGADVERLLTLFETHSIDVQFVRIDVAGHAFPSNFKDELTQAIDFIFPTK